MSEKARLLRKIPQLDSLARREDLAALLDREGRALGLRLLRGLLDGLRSEIQAGSVTEEGLEGRIHTIGPALQEALAEVLRSSAIPVINATGVVVHTNLGRSVLSEKAVEAVAEVARGYSTLEFDVPTGGRGSRHVHCEELMCKLTGAEAAMAVNNNAAAVMIGQPFDLRIAPLLRSCIYALPDNEVVLLVTAHHIIADGMCVQLIRDELAQLYSQPALLAMPVYQYADFARWQHESAAVNDVAEGLQWWQQNY